MSSNGYYAYYLYHYKYYYSYHDDNWFVLLIRVSKLLCRSEAANESGIYLATLHERFVSLCLAKSWSRVSSGHASTKTVKESIPAISRSVYV